MNEVSRFERGERYSQSRDVTTFRGVDPLTGLDVLIYEFAGSPTVASGMLGSDNIPAILATAANGGRGTVVCALPQGAELVAPGERTIDDGFALQALAALRDAHALGLVHGDITASRLLHTRSQVYLEGYGVPWGGDTAATGEAALHADLRALMQALLSIAGDNFSAEVSAALKGAAAKGSYPPMTAPRLHAIIRRLAGGAVRVPTAGFNDLTLPVGVSGAEVGQERGGAARPPQEPAAPRPATQNSGASSGAQQPPVYDDPDPITLNSDPGLVLPNEREARSSNGSAKSSAGSGQGSQMSPHDTSPGFVKALPPGATYRDGNVDDGLRPAPIRLDRQEVAAARRRSWRGPALLLLVLLVAGLASYLALISQRQLNDGTTPANVFPIEVRVEPANSPPIQLIVDQSPPGSTYAAGTVMGSVPKRVHFDAIGTWVVHGKFQENLTPPISVSVPQDTTITLPFPSPVSEQR